MQLTQETLQTQAKALLENRLAASLVGVVLLVLLAWWLGAFIASQLQISSQPKLPVWSAKPVKESQGTASFLFGKFTAKTEKPKTNIDPNALKKSSLNLSLVGVIDMGNRGAALIQKSGKTLVVLEGEQIMPRVTLIDVLGDQAIILHNGAREKLLLKRKSNKQLFTQEAVVEEPSEPAVMNSQLNTYDNDQLNEIGKTLKKQPMAIAKYIRFQPINQNGKWTSVKLWAKSDRALFEAIGFRDGDLLKRVNGKSINDMAKNPALWQEFLNGNEFDLIVERDGAEEPISVRFDS